MYHSKSSHVYIQVLENTEVAVTQTRSEGGSGFWGSLQDSLGALGLPATLHTTSKSLYPVTQGQIASEMAVGSET